VIEKLHFVYAYDLHAEDYLAAKFSRAVDGYGVYAAIVARYYALGVEAIIYGRLEYLGALARYLGAADAANQLLALAAEHAARDHFNPASLWP
jgi:hypothetical protein